jgi:hypothetical protein
VMVGGYQKMRLTSRTTIPVLPCSTATPAAPYELWLMSLFDCAKIFGCGK